jgi:hypothetical protein
MQEQRKLWLSRAELSARWGVALPTLAAWACQGRGPKYAKFGRQVRYRIDDVEAYEAQASSST